MDKSDLRKVTFTLNGFDVLGFQNLNLGDIVAEGKDAVEFNKKKARLFPLLGK